MLSLEDLGAGRWTFRIHPSAGRARLRLRERLGICTFRQIEGELEFFLDFVSSCGVRYVEIRGERPYLLPQDLGREKAEELRVKLEERGLEPIIHSPVYDVNIASLNPLIRRASIRQTLESVRFASQLGARVVIVHPGRLPRDFPREYLSNSRINLLASLVVMARIAGRMGVSLALENSPRGRAYRLIATPQEHLYILRKVASPHLGALLDLGHAHTWGLDLREYIRVLGDHLLLCHLHDNRGRDDEHLPLGKGSLDLRGVLEEVERLGRVVPLVLVLRRKEDVLESLSYLEGLEGERGGIFKRIFRQG